MPTAVTVESLTDARRHARALCGAVVPADRCDDVLLVLSELVGNACSHGAAAVTYDVLADGSDVLVTVEDANPSPPPDAAGAPSDEAENGRGLLIVDALARAWGWRLTPRGKAVWARV